MQISTFQIQWVTQNLKVIAVFFTNFAKLSTFRVLNILSNKFSLFRTTPMCSHKLCSNSVLYTTCVHIIIHGSFLLYLETPMCTHYSSANHNLAHKTN